MPHLLDITESYLRTSVAAIAHNIDTNPDTLFHALKSLGELGVLALRIPTEWGGKGVSEDTFQSFQELVAKYSGALAFLQTQHQSAAAMLFDSKNTSLKQEYLPRMSKGEVLVGVGFSQLRRSGDPLISATPVDGGYLLEGQVPWVTGWRIFQYFIVAASLSDGRAVFGMLPFGETKQSLGGHINFSEPMQLATMTSTNTVTATIKDWFLPDDRILSIKPQNWIHENDRKNVLRATGLVIGCARAGLDIIEAAAINKSLPFINKAFVSLNNELAQCRTAIREAQQQTNIELSEKLHLRSWAIELAVRIAHAAITVSSGAANYSNHAAQRVYREALVFTVSGQTTALMEATLERLTRSQTVTRKSEHKTITYSQVIHLSHVIDTDIPQWPGDPPVEFEIVAELEKHGYYLRRFSIGEHSATHINAPNSFHATGVGIDRYPAESLIVPAVVIDIRDKVADNFDYTLTINDVKSREEQHGEIPANSIVLLYTGWQEKWLDKNAFFNQDSEGNLHFPAFARETTQFLIAERQIAGVGIDTHGVDCAQDPTFATNRLVLAQSGIVLENLTNLDRLPPIGTILVIGLLRLKDGSGSPAAVIALVP
ncbi:cyclase family protein [Aerosakkonema funiforme]|uniref:cyclase family protein n=1 Tax=Aerosakkonema funiforme TaxID=1246630 RepID=UPI0035B71C71